MYRVRVGLRVEQPGGVGGEPDWWLSSIRTSTEWRRQAIPFESLYPADTNADRALDLRRVVGLLFYIDPGTDVPVTEGAPVADGEETVPVNGEGVGSVAAERSDGINHHRYRADQRDRYGEPD